MNSINGINSNAHNIEVEKVFSIYETSQNGLTTEEANKRLLTFGKNELSAKKGHNLFIIFLLQWKEILTIILTVVAIIDFVFAFFDDKSKMSEHLVEAGIIFSLVFINVVIATIQEAKANSSLEALKKMQSPICKVIRDGKLTEIPAYDLVPGDLCFMDDGYIIPADIRLINTRDMKIQESAITGESLAIEKDSSKIVAEDATIGDQVNMAFASTVVMYGNGTGVVVATGMNTQIGKIAKLLNTVEKEVSPFTKNINKLSFMLTIFAILTSIVLFCIMMIPHFSPHNSDNEPIKLIEKIILVTAIGISSIPEALPPTVSITLAVGVKKMAEQKALLKKLTTVVSLANVDIICSDKTGTLTLNKMTVTKACNMFDIESERNSNVEETKENVKHYDKVILGCILCNNSEVNFENQNEIVGDPTEAAMLVFANNVGYSINKIKDEYKRIYELPFDSVRKRMSVVVENNNNKIYSFTKGACEEMLPLCNKYISVKGVIKQLTSVDIENIKKSINYLSSKALRVLGVCFKNYDKEKFNKDNNNVEEDMIFCGLVGMIDPPREEVKDAIKVCKDAKIDVAMITGDHSITALAIAKQLNICSEENTKVVTGNEIANFTDEELKTVVKTTNVYARVSPNDKLRIVNAYKENGNITAMTGDGVNDAPALKTADIGIAMGKSGTDVAKDASDMLLLDDNFSTIKNSVIEGRRLLRNIINVITFIIVTNIATGLFIVLSILIFKETPLNTKEVLIFDLVTDTLPCIALGINPNISNLISFKPKKNSLLSLFRVISIIIFACMIATISLIAYWLSGRSFFIKGDSSVDISFQKSTCAFVVLSVSRILLSINIFGHHKTFLSKESRPNMVIFLSTLFSISLVLLFTLIPHLNSMIGLNLERCNTNCVILLVCFSIASFIIFEFLKIIYFFKKK